jgi:hypothetical protein
MRVEHWKMPLLGDPLETRIVLSKREAAALRRAADVLADIRSRLEDFYGEDGAIDEPGADAWVYADSYLGGALSDLICDGTTIAGLPPAEDQK